MGYIDQFVASATFDTKKMIESRAQNAWKSILYLLIFVLTTNGIYVWLRWDYNLELLGHVHSSYGADSPDPDNILMTHIFTQYILVFLDLALHFLLLGLIAYVGWRSYKRMGLVAYRESWTMAVYGISLPILVRLVVRVVGIDLPFLDFAYWGAIMLFNMLCLKRIMEGEH